MFVHCSKNQKLNKMPYLWNEKRFRKNSNGFEFHVDRYRTSKILAKIGEYFFAVLKGFQFLKDWSILKRSNLYASWPFLHTLSLHILVYCFITHTPRRTPPSTSHFEQATRPIPHPPDSPSHLTYYILTVNWPTLLKYTLTWMWKRCNENLSLLP